MSVLIILASLIFFKQEIKNICLANISKVLNTDVSIKNAEIQFFQTFPKITLELQDLKIKEAVEGSTDSLLVLESVNLGFDIKELINGNLVINRCKLKNGYVRIRVDALGNPNYMIFKPSPKDKDAEPFSLNIADLEIENVELLYDDLSIKNKHKVFANHANCTLSHTTTKTEIAINGTFICAFLGVNDQQYLEDKPFTIDANLTYDQALKKLIFDKSKIKLENAPFEIDGSLIVDTKKIWDLKIASPNTDLQSLTSLLPHEISKELLAYKSSGNLYFSGKIEGEQSPNVSPLIDFAFGFNNASFYHPNIDQKITRAKLEGKFTNGAKRNSSTTVLSLKNFSGYLGNDLLRGNIIISNFNDPYLDVDIKGNFDVASVLKLYPVKQLKKASGKIDADVNFKGKLSYLTDITKTQHIKTSGKFYIRNIDFQLDEVGLDFKDFNGMFYFDKHDLGISKLTGIVGKSDFEVKGFFKNFIAYVLLENEILKIQAEFNSNYVNVNEILSKGMDESKTASSKASNDKHYSFHLSPFLAYDLNCHIKELDFRKMTGSNTLKNLTGKLMLRDRLLHYQNLSMDVAEGNVRMNGVINASDTSKIQIRNNTTLSNIDVTKAFHLLENFGQSFITDKNLKGKLSANVETILKFDSKLHLDINSLSSMAEIKIVNGALIQFEPMQEIGVFLRKKAYAKYLKSSDFNNVNFSKLENTILISKGIIEIPEMVVQSDLTPDLTIKGTHGFNDKINYSINFPLINYVRDEKLESKGIEVDKQKRWHLYLTAKGTVDNYKIDLEENRSIKSAAAAAGSKANILFQEDAPKIVPLDTDGTFDTYILEDL